MKHLPRRPTNLYNSPGAVAIEVMAQELGRNPVLLNRVKEIFREKAILNCSPTEKGKAKIDEFHRYYVRLLKRLHT